MCMSTNAGGEPGTPGTPAKVPDPHIPRLPVGVLQVRPVEVSSWIIRRWYRSRKVSEGQQRQPFTFTWKNLIPNERTGIALRWALEETDGDVPYQRNQEFMKVPHGKTSAFDFCTVADYLRIAGAVCELRPLTRDSRSRFCGGVRLSAMA